MRNSNDRLAFFRAFADREAILAYFRVNFPSLRALSPDDRLLIGAPGEEPLAALGVELPVAGDSPIALGSRAKEIIAVAGYFVPDMRWLYDSTTEAVGARSPRVMALWAEESLAWLQKATGGRIARAVLFDDGTAIPTLKFAIKGPPFFPLLSLPLTAGVKAELFLALDLDYRRHLSDRGLVSEQTASKPAAWKIRSYYERTHGWEEGIEESFPLKWDPRDAPELKGFPRGAGRVEREEFIRNAAAAIFQRNYPTLLRSLATAELEKERVKLERESYLKNLGQRRRAADDLREQADLIRGPSLENVLRWLHGARESLQDRPQGDGERAFLLPGGRRIFIAAERWRDEESGLSGAGALSLAAHLAGHGPENADAAIHELAAAFPLPEAIGALARDRSLESLAEVKKYLAEPYQFPETPAETWPAAEALLTETGYLSQEAARANRALGLLRSDKRGAALLVCARESGVFRFSATLDPKVFALEHPCPQALPFVLEGSADELLIAVNPLEALRLKFQKGEPARVLALGFHAPETALEPYLAVKAIRLQRAGRDKKQIKISAYLKSRGAPFTEDSGLTFPGAPRIARI
ncbi:MAG: hypothetical protein LBO66_14115 [Deltaproteobacteria bacterium]|jgi:hypothetical protein|nr:hypothetical protein [Deltaproteobacteria bacterium]